jgi:hypothetical protein
MRIWMLMTALYIALPAAAAESKMIAGRLCITGSECVRYKCGQKVTPAPVSRGYHFVADGETTYILGTLKAGETAITCDSSGTIELRVSAPSLPRDGRVRVAIGGESNHSWELSLSGKQLRSSVIRTPAHGPWTLTFEKEHFRTIRKTVRIGERPEVLTAVLEPLPVISGRVFERGTISGVGGATVKTDVGTVAIAEADGSFAFEADPDKWPAAIVVSAAGFAETAEPIAKAQRTARLEDIFLHRGGSIIVEMFLPNIEDVVQVELRKLRSGDMVGAPWRSVTPTAAGEGISARFDGVEPGQYLVLAKGKEPCEQHGKTVLLDDDAEIKVALNITPVRLRFRATVGGEPLTGARVNYKNIDGRWEASFKTGPEGDVMLALWQTGPSRAGIFSDGLMNIPYFERRELADDEDLEWIFEIIPRRITGTVVDARTGAPIPNAVLSLRVRGETSFAVKARSDPAGRFEFFPVPYGTHTITAASATHLEGRVSYTFSEPSDSRDVTVRLEGGASVKLRVLDGAGAPVVHAVAMQYKGLQQTRMSLTDENGVAEVLVPEGEERDVFVVPRDGSFAITRVSSSPPEATIRLPWGTSRIEIRAESESRQPIGNVSVAIRYNKTVLPREVVQAFGNIQGSRTSSNGDGNIILDHMPSGLYELWPAGSAAELEMLLAGIGQQAPATMTVTPGRNTAVLTFAAVELPKP